MSTMRGSGVIIAMLALVFVVVMIIVAINAFTNISTGIPSQPSGSTANKTLALVQTTTLSVFAVLGPMIWILALIVIISVLFLLIKR